MERKREGQKRSAASSHRRPTIVQSSGRDQREEGEGEECKCFPIQEWIQFPPTVVPSFGGSWM